MINRIKVALLSLVVMLGGVLAVPALASAGITGNLCEGSTNASGSTDTSAGSCTSQSNLGNGTGIKNISKQVVDIISIFVGAVSIIMIIYGGFRYITSGGESGKVGNAKNTLIYAVIGLVIVALAQFIVNVVLTGASNIQNSATTGSSVIRLK